MIAAEGEVQAAEKLALAAATIAGHPGALQLRLFQTLVEVSGEASSTIVFPVPIDLTSGMGGVAPQSQAQIQSMMQTALMMATKHQEQKQLEGRARADADDDSSDARSPLGVRRGT